MHRNSILGAYLHHLINPEKPGKSLNSYVLRLGTIREKKRAAPLPISPMETSHGGKND
ncbi:MAG: hypothetical protein ABH863_05210 [Candidatus Micrarchaeota archaeon]